MLGERASITENRHRWYVVMSQVRAAGGDYDTAISLLDQAETLYRHGFYPDVRPIAALKARVQITRRYVPGAWADDQRVSVDDQPDYLREYAHLTGSAAARQPGGHGGARSARSAAHAAAEEAGRDGSVLEIRVLQALASLTAAVIFRRRSPHSAEASTRPSRRATRGCSWTRALQCWPS